MTKGRTLPAWAWLSHRWHLVALALLVATAILLRVGSYGDPRLSIATSDTNDIIESSHLPLLSWQFLTSNRTATIALLYKILEPGSGYALVQIGQPAFSDPTVKAYQPGLDRIVVAQMVLAILAWSALAMVTARHLNNRVLKVVGAALILGFGFSPALAEWDSVLMSEPVSLSLFALLLALTLELAVRIANLQGRPDTGTRVVVGIWLVILVLWVFARDSNAYVLPVTIVMILLVLSRRSLRRRLPSPYLLGLAVLLAGLFVFHNATLRASDRWINPFLNNLIYKILPEENRLAFFNALGMPTTEEVLAFRTSRGNESGFLALPDFMAWVRTRGYPSYARFLLAHPRWAVNFLMRNLGFLFSENFQPYYREQPGNYPVWFKPIGEMLHPTSSAPVLMDALATLGLLVLAWRLGGRALAIGWFFLWLLLGEFLMLFVAFCGDSLGVIRHALVAIVPLRLSLWVLPLFGMDFALRKEP